MSELLERFYDVDSGDILFDGVSIRDYKQDSLRGAMSLVSQDTVLFNDSIKNNIALGNRNASDEEIVALVNYLRTAFAGAKEEVSPEAVAALRQSPLSPAEVLKRRP